MYQEDQHLLLVRCPTVVGSIRGFVATEVGPFLSMHFPAERLDAKLLVAPPRQVFCDGIVVGAIGTDLEGNLRDFDSAGSPIDFASPEEQVLRMAENCEDLRIDPAPSEDALPAFVTRRPAARTVIIRTQVRLHVERVADLPDLKAALDSLDDMTGTGTRRLWDLAQLPMPEARPASELFWEAARSTRIRAGMHLPVVLQSSRREIPGVLRLEALQLPRCLASFLTLDEAPTIGPGMRFVRRVCWRSAPGGIPKDEVTERAIATVDEASADR